MSYIFKRTESNLYTVGFEDTTFHPLIDVPRQELALMWIHYLNGGGEPLAMPPKRRDDADFVTQFRDATRSDKS